MLIRWLLGLVAACIPLVAAAAATWADLGQPGADWNQPPVQLVTTLIAGQRTPLLTSRFDSVISRCISDPQLAWEWAQTATLGFYLPADGSGLAIDAGANIGTKTVALGRKGRVLAFEPMRWTADLLAGNLALNGLSDRVRVVRAALANGPAGDDPNIMETMSLERASVLSKEEAFRLANSGEESGFFHMDGHYAIINLGGFSAVDVPRRQVPHNGSVAAAAGWPLELVPVLALDWLRLGEADAGALPCPDVFKIDLEGGDLAAILGARETLKRCRPVLIVEAAGSGPGGRASNRRIAGALEQLGYSMFWALSEDCTHPPETAKKGAPVSSLLGNMLAVPAECALVHRPDAVRAEVLAIASSLLGLEGRDALVAECKRRHEWARRPAKAAAALDLQPCGPEAMQPPHLMRTPVDTPKDHVVWIDEPFVYTPLAVAEKGVCLQRVALDDKTGLDTAKPDPQQYWGR